jgi:hypothetical protein
MTPLERIEFALDRMKTRGWGRGRARQGPLDGPGCLVGSLYTDAEIALLGRPTTPHGWHLPDRCNALPEVDAAVAAMGFDPVTSDFMQSAHYWNDMREEPYLVQLRLEQARDLLQGIAKLEAEANKEREIGETIRA